MPPTPRFGPDFENPEKVHTVDIPANLIRAPLDVLIATRLDTLTLLRAACEQRDQELMNGDMKPGGSKHAHITELIDELQAQSNELQAAISFQEQHVAVHGETLGVPHYKSDPPEVTIREVKARLDELREELLNPDLEDSVRGAVHTEIGELVTQIDELQSRSGGVTTR